MNVHHFVIHHIQKVQHRDPVIQTKDHEAQLTDDAGQQTKQGELIENFVESADKMFNRQRSGKVYADIGRDANTFAEALDRYLEGNTPFLEFSDRIAKELMSTMKSVTLATGGYMAVAEYTGSPRQLLIIMIRQEEGYAVDPDTLELRQSIQLDLSTINVGARINLDDYEGGDAGHLALVRGLKEIAKYFREFLGVENFKDAKQETEELKSVLDAYLHQNSDKFDSDKITEIKRDVAHLIIEQKGVETSLMAIASLVDPQDPQNFFDYANNEGISAELHGDPTAVKGWIRVRYRDKRLTLDFERRLLNDSIHWQKDEDQLIVKVSDFPSLSIKLEEADR